VVDADGREGVVTYILIAYLIEISEEDQGCVGMVYFFEDQTEEIMYADELEFITKEK
tara:strand:+ start:81 stop:251 length:171 start_codon:yes stop_codon:yes gene_type:complete